MPRARSASPHRRSGRLIALIGLVLIGHVGRSWAQQTAPTIPASFGVNFTPSADRLPAAVSLAERAGFRVFRADVTWADVERSPGRFDFTALDRLLGRLEAHSRLVLILAYGHPHYDGGRPPHSSDARAAFARFAAATVGHVAERGRRGVTWEIWNEPNLPRFWPPVPDPSAYTALVRVTAPAIRAVDSTAIVCGPAIATPDNAFLDSCARAGLLPLIDALSVHLYGRSTPEAVLAPLIPLRGWLDRNGAADRPILVTESGYATAWPGVSDRVQAQYLVREELLSLLYGVPVHIHYNWNRATNRRDPEAMFGLVTAADRATAALTAHQRLARTLAGHRVISRLPTDNRRDWLILLADSLDRPALAAWTERNGRPAVPLPLESARARAVTMRPGRSPIRGTTLTLSGEPVVIFPTGPEPTLRLAARLITPPILTLAAGADTTLPLTMRGRWPMDAVVTALSSTGDTLGTSRPATGAPLRITWPSFDDQPTNLVVTVRSGMTAFRRRIPLVIVNPLTVEPQPTPGGLAVTVRNPSRRPFSGTVAVDNQTRPIQFDDGDSIRTIALHDSRGRVTLRSRGASAIGTVPTSRPILTVGAGWSVEGAGLPVLSVQPIQPGDGPFAAAGSALRVRYVFSGDGYWQLIPPIAERPIVGSARAVGFWLRGDGSGHAVRCRFTDRTGQTFQPKGVEMTWRGWRFVTMPLDGSDAIHWDGANDGVVHGPISWTAPVLIDRTSHAIGEREVLVAGFVLM